VTVYILKEIRPVTDRLPPQPLLGLLLRLVYQYYAQDVDAALRAAGFGDIRPPHANVFPFVPAEGIQVSELAKLASVRKQTMAQAVEQLERAGYLERRPDPHDRRARLVFLTAKGRAVGPVAVASGRRVEERWARLTSPEEIEALRGSLHGLLSRLMREPGSESGSGAEAIPAAGGSGRAGHGRGRGGR
jgi:DNA-binding MarR family transcriptional regulator